MAVRIGVVGLGGMGRHHFNAYSGIDGAEVVAVCDVDGERLKDKPDGPAMNIEDPNAGRARIAEAAAYLDYAEMFASEKLDMTDICVPTDLHDVIALAAIGAGLHVVCEKPMALTSARARAVAAAADEAGRLVMLGHTLRFWPEYVMLKEMIDSGRYGRLLGAVFRRVCGQPTWDSGSWFLDVSRSGGAALDLHIHDADLVQWFFGRPKSVTSAGVAADDGGIDQIITQYDVSEIPMVAAEGVWVPGAVPFTMSVRLVFEATTVSYDIAKTPTLTVYPAGGEAECPPVPKEDGLTEELRYFVGCVANNTPPDRIPPCEAISAIAIVEAELESISRGPGTVVGVDA